MTNTPVRPSFRPRTDKPAVFNTISNDDWKRSIALGRARKNAVTQQIRDLIAGGHPQSAAAA